MGTPHHKTKKRSPKKYYGLTRRQKDLLVLIKKFLKNNKYSPSYEELKQVIGLKSKSVVHSHLHCLKKRGYIMFKPGARRSIMVL